ncbi:MAG: exosortase H [bacterium]
MAGRTKKFRGKQSPEAKGRARSKESHHELGLSLEGRLKLFFRRNRVVLWAGSIFSFCILLSILAYSMFLESGASLNLRIFTARATSLILSLFSIPTEVKGTIVSSSDFSIDVVTECIGVVPMLIFASAVLAYPSKIKQKLAGIGLSIVSIYLLNLVRTVSLFYLGAAYPDLFKTAHLVVWQALIILFTVILWLFWLEKIVKEGCN